MTDCWSTSDGLGPPVVLVHGTMDRSSSFARVARRCVDRTVVRYDRRGYGRSLAVGPPATFEDQLDDLAAVIGRHCPTAPILFGHSYGGTVSLAFAARHPSEVRHVVAYEPPTPWLPGWRDRVGPRPDEPDDPADVAEAFMVRSIGPERWRRLPPSTRRARRAEGKTLVAELAHIRPPIATAAPPFDPDEITIDVLIARGTTSPVHLRDGAATLADRLPGGRLVAVEGADHGVHLRDASAVVDLIAAAEI